MHKTKTITILASLALLAIVALVGAMTYQNVYAQTPTQTPEPGTGDNADVPALPNRAGRMQHFHGVTQEALADALGIDVDTLTAAQETATQQALEQAVSAGLITQEQANRLAERGFAGKFGFGKGVLASSEIDYDALLADALNISVDDLEAARQEAFITTIDNAVAEGAITAEQGELIKGQHALFNNEGFQTSMQSAFEAAVQQAVSGGVITQDQADLILQAQAERGGFFGRGGRGLHGFGGHGRGGPGAFPGLTPPDSTPSDSGTSLDL